MCMLFFFNQKTAYEMRISDWSSDVCSSDLKGRRSDALDNSGSAKPVGGTQRDKACVEIAPLKLVQHCTKDHCTRCPEWMAHGNRAAIDVDLVVRNFHVAHIAKHDARKSFVQFEEVNVLFCHARDFQGFLANCGRRRQHDRRLRTDVGISANASARFQPRLFTKLLGTN